MKKAVFILLLIPLFSTAQKRQPVYKNDTLYTTCGYKIYKGITLHFGQGIGRNGVFQFMNVKNDQRSFLMTNNTMVVKKLKNFGISMLGNAYIEVIGYIVYKDGSKGVLDIHMAFENAIRSLPPELLVPDEFQATIRTPVSE